MGVAALATGGWAEHGGVAGAMKISDKHSLELRVLASGMVVGRKNAKFEASS